jgi:glc operon protein GlcG
MDEGFVIRRQVALTLAGAQAVVSAATAKAREIEVDECLAVVDRGGALVAFARMDAARIGSVQVALTKAVSAATRRRPTAEENAGDVALGIRLALAANNAVTNIGGGLPIVVDGQVIGAAGVSSGTVDEDVLVAQAGLAPLATL